VQIERGASNTLVVMARVTLSPSYWLLHFTDIERGGNAYCVVEPGNSGGAFISLTFTETTAPVALDGEVLLAPPGNWNVKIYEQTSSINLVPASANRLVKDVDIFVVGDGVADGGWTETCPADGDECDPLSLRVNGEPYASITDPCGAIATVEVVQGGVGVGEFIGGQWVVPECPPCDDLSYTLVNTDDTELESGVVVDPCGASLDLVAPDADVTFDGLPVLTVPSGATGNLDCGTLLNAAYVQDGGSVTGTYLITGTLNSRNVYTLDVDHNLEYTGTRWRLVKPGSDVDAALGSQTFPWDADWSATSVTVEQATIGAYCGGDEVPCADLTIAINGTTYGTVADPCGATAAVNVHDSNGNDVGSLVSGSWVVAPPANVLREYTTGGSWSKPTDASFTGVWVFAAGGGGSGGAGGVAITAYGAGGGGGGAIVRLWIPAASLGLTETYAIGAGGAGPSTGNGSAGGATLFGLHVEAKGGNGGLQGGPGNPQQAAGGSPLTSIPSGSGASISGAPGGRGRREPGSGVLPGSAVIASIFALGGVVGFSPVATGGAGGGSGGGYSNVTGTGLGGSDGAGCYQGGILVAGGAGGAFGGGNGTAGTNDIYLDPFLGLVTPTIGLGTAGGGGGGTSGATAGGTGAGSGRAAGGGGGGSTQTGTRGAGGAGGDGFLLVYEVFAI
jgi:hypothetical protein